MMKDIRQAFRHLAKNPGFAVAAILVLALGIGANTAIYTVVRNTLFSPLPHPEPERIVVMASTAPSRGWDFEVLSLPEIRAHKERNSRFSDVAVMNFLWDVTLQGRGRAERLTTAWVTSSYFEILGAEPVLGRGFLPEEDVGVDAHPVAVLSHAVWLNRLGGDPGVIGSEITLNKRTFTVIGVMPQDFHGLRDSLDESAEIWLPLVMGSGYFGGPDMFESSTRQHYALARLRDGVSLAEARRTADEIARQLENEDPNNQTGLGVVLRPLPEFFYGDLEKPLTTLQVAALLVLLLCCVNVATLLLVRARTRRGELAMRVALGAPRRHLMRSLLVEGGVLALLGGGLGVLLALATPPLLIALDVLDLPAFVELEADLGVIGASLGLVLLTGLVFSFLPAFLESRTAPQIAIREAGQRTKSSTRGFYPMVMIEAFLAIVLLVGAGLTAKSFYRFATADLGFETEHFLTFRLDLVGERYEGPAWGLERRVFAVGLLEELRALPGVDHAAVWSPSMIGDAEYQGHVTPGEADSSNPENWRSAQLLQVTPGALEAMEIPILAGRTFGADDWGSWPDLDGDGQRQLNEMQDVVVILSEKMAESLWPGQEAVGRGVWLYGSWGSKATVIGVAAEARHRGRREEGREVTGDVYLTYNLGGLSAISVLLRSPRDAESLEEPIRSTVARLDPELAVYDVATIEERLARENAEPAFVAGVMGFYAVTATGLAAIGLFGLLAYVVRQRRSELAIRGVLGAQRGGMVLLVLRQAMLPVVLGLAAGIVAALVFSRQIEGLLYDVPRVDASIYVMASALFLLVALLAALLPARWASRQDPMIVLRQE